MRRRVVSVVSAALTLIVVGLLGVSAANAHRSGCHRWHSCPSDTGSYVCGDLGYPCQYPSYPSRPVVPSYPMPSSSTPSTSGAPVTTRSSSYFSSPSGNIRCVFTRSGPGVQCRTVNNNRSAWLRRSGRWTTYINSYVPSLRGPVLAYGRSKTRSGIRCTSRTSGIRCSANGSGFLIARSGIRTF